VCAGLPELAHLALPGWVRQRLVADALRFSHDGVESALNSMGGRAWVWATEFENVHEMWRFAEPRLRIDGVTYANSEAYFHAQKPRPFDDAVWRGKRVGVMKKGLRAKFLASKEAREVLLKSHPHPLLSIKNDAFWGFDPRFGGENMARICSRSC
jgi:predicted NAD-dependent protein-ADP-ribosyltransferase YbiA (DUF1768 family)